MDWNTPLHSNATK